jgi:hypothetical protein
MHGVIHPGLELANVTGSKALEGKGGFDRIESGAALIHKDAPSVLEDRGKVLGKEIAVGEFIGELIEAKDGGPLEEEMDFDFVPCADSCADADGFGRARGFPGIGRDFDEEIADHGGV